MVDTSEKDMAVLLLGDRGFEVVDVYGESEAMTSPMLPGFRLGIARRRSTENRSRSIVWF